MTHNTTNGNGVDGIAADVLSTVSFNTADDNERNGIFAFCPSTITHNAASGNADRDISLIGVGCVDQDSTTLPSPP